MRDEDQSTHLEFFSFMKIFCAASEKMRDENIWTMIFSFFFLYRVFSSLHTATEKDSASFNREEQKKKLNKEGKILLLRMEFSINRNAQQWPLITYFKYFTPLLLLLGELFKEKIEKRKINRCHRLQFVYIHNVITFLLALPLHFVHMRVSKMYTYIREWATCE